MNGLLPDAKPKIGCGCLHVYGATPIQEFAFQPIQGLEVWRFGSLEKAHVGDIYLYGYISFGNLQRHSGCIVSYNFTSTLSSTSFWHRVSDHLPTRLTYLPTSFGGIYIWSALTLVRGKERTWS